MITEDDNKVVQSLWIGKELSIMERLCIKSFIKNGHEFHLYAYDEISNVPQETILKDANQIVPKEKIFMDSSEGVAAFSDYFRYKLLYRNGGWWVDMDSICLRYFDIPGEYCFSTEGQNVKDAIINCGFIKTPPEADFLKDCIDFIEQEKDIGVVEWGIFGPVLFKTVLTTYDSAQYLKPPDVFCPIPFEDINQLISKREENIEFSSKTLAIHLWNEGWRRYAMDKSAMYPPSSIYEKLKKLYL